MRKFFSLAFAFIFFSVFFVLNSVSANTCSNCHDSTDSALSFDAVVAKVLDIKSSQENGVATQFLPASYDGQTTPVILAGKTSGFIQPFYVSTLSDKPILYDKSEYLPEPGYPLTDEENLFSGANHSLIKKE
jgi:hypothetical protein